MRKFYLFILIITNLTCFAQENIDRLYFKVEYKPEMTYTQTTEQTSQNEIKYFGSDEFLKRVKDKGIENPTISTTESKNELVLKTGKLSDELTFPLTMEFVKSNSSDGKKIIPDGTIIYGHGKTGTMPTLDSIASNELENEYKKTLLQSLQSIFSQIAIPEKNIKVGESFSQESPISIPIGSVKLDMGITTIYKLINIKNGIAEFEISQIYKMLTTVTDYKMQGTGSGKGNLFYDIKKNFTLKYLLKTEMEMKVDLEKFGLEVKSKSGFTQLSKIDKN